MRRHAKASPAGSTEGSGDSRGLFRRAFVTRRASSEARGSGAPLVKHARSLFAVLALAICACAIAAAPATAAPPSAILEPTSGITETGAHLNGTIETTEPSYWRFDISTDGVTWSENVLLGGPVDSQKVDGDISGLAPNTKYFVRFVIYLPGNGPSSTGTYFYSDVSKFTTLGAPGVPFPAVLSIADASSVSILSAKATGEVERPAGADSALDTRCNFEYVTDAQFAINGFGTALPVPCQPESLLTTAGKLPVNATLKGLSPATTYHLRLAAENAGGTDVKTASSTFTTAPGTAPAVTLDPPVAKYTTVHLSGAVDPEGGNNDTNVGPQPIAWQFEVNREGAGWQFAAGGVISGQEPPEGGGVPALGNAPIAISRDLQNVPLGTEYKVRLKAFYAGNLEALSSEGTFKTKDGPITPPVVTIDPASLLTANTAHFSGDISLDSDDPAFATTCAFEYITDAAYAARNEQQKLRISATGGSYTLALKGETTAAIPYNALASQVDSAIEALPAIGPGGVSVTGGPGNAKGTSPYTLTFPGVNADTISVDGSALSGSGTASVVTTVPGDAGHDEAQRLSINATGGTYKLSFEGQQTGPIASNASASEVQSALEALPAIAAGDVTVIIPNQYFPGLLTVTFTGSFAQTDVSQMSVDSSALTVAASTDVQTTIEGHAAGFDDAQTIACNPNPVEGEGATEVKANPVGLEPGTTYHLRLRGTQPSGASVFAVADTFSTENGPPVIAEVSVTDVTISSAILNAQIRPSGNPTTYHFEYLTLAAFEEAGETFTGAISTPESASIGADNQLRAASAAIGGLLPDTAYRFRVVATNSKSAPGGTAGPNKPFRTLPTGAASGDACPNAAVRAQQGSAFLPECRAYEIVNPPGLDFGDVNRMPWASDDGDQVSFATVGPGDISLGGGVASWLVAHRTPTGWNSVSADPAAAGPVQSTGIVSLKAFSTDFSRALVVSNFPMLGNPDDLDGTDDFYRVDVGHGTTTMMTGDIPNGSFPGAVAGISQSLDRIVYTLGKTAYMSDGISTEELGVEFPPDVVLSDGATPSVWGMSWGLGVPENNSSSPQVVRGGAHAVSDNARRIYLAGDTKGSVFLRDLAASPKRTVPLSLSERTVDAGKTIAEKIKPSIFISASHDGSKAYFESGAQLTDAATPGGGIYRFDLNAPAGQRLTQITPDAGRLSGLNIGNAISSDDQSHIYFISTSALAAGAHEGDRNAYVWTASGVRFIANAGDASFRRATQDGSYALLLGTSSIEGAPNNGNEAIYEYSYATNQVSCVSCRPDGSASQGDASIGGQSVGYPGAPLSRNRAVATDGRVAFNSTDRIYAADQNSKSDVYVYNRGNVSLLSTGRDQDDTFVGDISDDGKNVTIITRAPLVGADQDRAELDVYDARAGGGFLEPPPPPAPCEGEACRDANSSSPTPSAPTTPNFIGPGNPEPCGKGKVRRNGRCVKSKPRKHPKKHKGKKHRRDANRNGRIGR